MLLAPPYRAIHDETSALAGDVTNQQANRIGTVARRALDSLMLEVTAGL